MEEETVFYAVEVPEGIETEIELADVNLGGFDFTAERLVSESGEVLWSPMQVDDGEWDAVETDS